MSSFVSHDSVLRSSGMYRQALLSVAILAFALPLNSFAQQPRARFDAPAVAPFVTVAAEGFNAAAYDPNRVSGPLPGERWIDLQIPVTHWLTSGTDVSLDEVEFQIVEASGRGRVIDFSPQAQMASDLAGNIAVERKDELNRNAHLEFAATGYAAVQASGNANVVHNRLETERYERLAPTRQVVASGTTHQGRGVAIRFRPAPQQPLEGAFMITLRMAIPADRETLLFRVIGQSSGQVNQGFGQGSRQEVLAREALWVACFAAESLEARRQADEFVDATLRLRRAACDAQRSEQHAQSPIDQVRQLFRDEKPELPSGWLEHLLTPGSHQTYSQFANRLPVNVRQSADQYLAQRDSFLSRVAAPTFTAQPDASAYSGSAVR